MSLSEMKFDFKKVLFVGDTHGDLENALGLVEEAVLTECEAIFVMGDFGFWEHTEEGEEFLDVLNRKLYENGKILFFVDGNHENHFLLKKDYHTEGNTTADGFHPIRNCILHSPRGNHFIWNGISFVTLGGAFSIDKAFRVEGRSWWYDELITIADMKKIKNLGIKADILLSHDAPIEVKNGYFRMIHKNTFFESNCNRECISEAATILKVKMIIHGHYHFRHSEIIKLNDRDVIVEGLDCEGVNQMMVVDLTTLQF